MPCDPDVKFLVLNSNFSIEDPGIFGNKDSTEDCNPWTFPYDLQVLMT